MTAPTDMTAAVSYARRLLTNEQQRQHLLAEQNQRLKLGNNIPAWKVESYARQEREARVGERILGELLSALPKGDA